MAWPSILSCLSEAILISLVYVTFLFFPFLSLLAPLPCLLSPVVLSFFSTLRVVFAKLKEQATKKFPDSPSVKYTCIRSSND